MRREEGGGGRRREDLLCQVGRPPHASVVSVMPREPHMIVNKHLTFHTPNMKRKKIPHTGDTESLDRCRS